MAKTWIKSQYFNADLMKRSLAKSTRAAWYTFGNILKKSIQKSMVKSPGRASRGSPPHSHEGGLKAYEGFDAKGPSLLVGPLMYPPRPIRAAPLLEAGGSAILTNASGTKKTAHYGGNPYLAPALKKQIQSGIMPKIWSASIRTTKV